MISNHFKDSDGNPAGGITYGTGFVAAWQNGPLGRGEGRQQPNGAFVENVLEAALDRIQFYQDSKFACEENQTAIEHIELALASLRDRTANREKRAVEGAHAI